MMSVCALGEKKRYAPSITESVYSSKSTCNLQRRKFMVYPAAIIKNKNNVSEIILSAREKRLKHLRSQLTDANFKLTELYKENNILKSIQKRHEAALQRYESVNGDIPKLMTGQTEETRSWQMRYKELKRRYREASQILNKKHLQFNKLTEDYDHLMRLTKQENLGELDDLQKQIKLMTLKLDKQQQTIDCLQRRLVLDEKAHKHKLNLERERRKDIISSQQSDEAVNQSSNSMPFSAHKEKHPLKVENKFSSLPMIQKKITHIKAMISEVGTLPPIPVFDIKNTMIPRLQIPIPETDKESSVSSVDEKSFRTRTLSRRSDSYISDFYDVRSEN